MSSSTKSVKLGDVVDAVAGLDQIDRVPLPIRVSLQLQKIRRELEEHQRGFDRELEEIIVKYGGRKTENGKFHIPFDQQKVDAANAEIAEIRQVYVKVDVVPLRLSALVNTEATIAPVNFRAMSKFLFDAEDAANIASVLDKNANTSSPAPEDAAGKAPV